VPVSHLAGGFLGINGGKDPAGVSSLLDLVSAFGWRSGLPLRYLACFNDGSSH